MQKGRRIAPPPLPYALLGLGWARRPGRSEGDTGAQDEDLRGGLVLRARVGRVQVAAALGNRVAAVLGHDVHARGKAVVAADAIAEATHQAGAEAAGARGGGVGDQAALAAGVSGRGAVG